MEEAAAAENVLPFPNGGVTRETIYLTDNKPLPQIQASCKEQKLQVQVREDKRT